MLKFLVVDDDDILRFSIKKILESRSYIVDEASDGVGALSMVEDRNYDGIFLDVNMPQMSGLEALSYIKRKNPSTFCVILTAYSNVSDALEAMKMGAYDYGGGGYHCCFFSDDDIEIFKRQFVETISKFARKHRN